MRNGFTFVEMLITIVILSLIIMISFGSIIPVIKKIETESIKETVDMNIKQLFVSARTRSFKEKKPYTLNYDKDNEEDGITKPEFSFIGENATITFSNEEIDTVTFNSSGTYSYVIGIFTLKDDNKYKVTGNYEFEIYYKNGLSSTITIQNSMPTIIN